MLRTSATLVPSGDHDGCATPLVGRPLVATVAPFFGSMTSSPVPRLIMRRDASALNVENSTVYVEPWTSGVSVGAGSAVLTASLAMSNTAPSEPPSHSAPDR